MGAWSALPEGIGLLLGLLGVKQLGDAAAKVATAGEPGGASDLWQLLGIEPRPAELKEAARIAKKGEAAGIGREWRTDRAKFLGDRADSLFSAASSAEQQSVIQAALSAAGRGSSVYDVLPAGMRPGELTKLMRADEIEAWRKVRDAGLSPMGAAAKGAERPTPLGPLAGLMAPYAPPTAPAGMGA